MPSPTHITRRVASHLPGLAAAGVVIAYCVARYGDCVLTFFFLDDFWLLRDAAQMPLDSPLDLLRVLGGTHTGFHLYRPLTQSAYFLALHRAVGTDATGYHLVQLAAFTLNALLVLAITSRLAHSLALGLCAALLYASAPGHAVAVYWVAAFTMTGTALAVFGMILVWLRMAGSARRGRVATLLQIIALLCSEHAVAAPPLLLAVSLLGSDRQPWRRVARDLLGPTAVVVAYVAAKGLYLTRWGRPGGAYAIDFDLWMWIERLGVYAMGTSNLLAVVKPGAPTRALLGLLVCAIALAASAAALRGVERCRLLALGADIFLLGLLPVLPLSAHQYDYFIGVAALGSALALIGCCVLAAGSRGALPCAAVLTLLVLGVGARSGDAAAEGGEMMRLYRGAALHSAAIIADVREMVRTQPPGTEVLLRRNDATFAVMGFGGAQRVFFDPPLRVRFIPPASLETRTATQLYVENPGRDGLRQPPFWWRPENEWMRRWLPAAHAWYRSLAAD